MTESTESVGLDSPIVTRGPVGSSTVLGEFRDKVEGRLRYAADQYDSTMLHGKVVRSVLPSARILSIDTAEAEALPGVVAVLTAEDVPHNVISEEASGLGLAVIRTPVLADSLVRYAGEAIAVIAAESPHIAESAAELVVVEYEPTEGVFDPETALEDGAWKVHDQGNVLVDWNVERGDIEGALRSAHSVIEGEYRTQAVDHAYLEPEAGEGWLDVDGVVTLRVATQVIEHSDQIASILDVPANRVRVQSSYMGGGFGGKEDMTVEPFLALLVRATGRRVRMVWSRRESMIARPKRHPFIMRYRTGVTARGQIVAQDVDIIGDAGAYPYLSVRVLFAGGVTATGPYRADNVRIRSRAVLTNNVPNSAFRGFGAMQVVLGYESQMDGIASELGLDRKDVRVANFLGDGDLLPAGEPVPTTPAVEATMHHALSVLPERTEPTSPSRRVGVGFACNMQPYGRTVFFRDRASAWIGFEVDGSVVIRAGVTDLGGGQAASLAQIAAEALGVQTESVVVHIGDTQLTPLAGGTFATRQLYMSGNGVLQTANELRDLMAPTAAEILGAPVDELAFFDGRVGTVDGSAALTTAEWVAACSAAAVPTAHLSTFYGDVGTFDPRTGQGRTFPDYTFGTHAARVAVDIETGVVEVLDYVGCHDVGRAINPLRVEGQIQGGVAQGIGYALSEEIVSDEGISNSALFADYLMPSTAEVPRVEAAILEIEPGKGPYGARGIGEPAIAPTAAAIASAIEDAIGVRLTQLPFTPERVLAALGEST